MKGSLGPSRHRAKHYERQQWSVLKSTIIVKADEIYRQGEVIFGPHINSQWRIIFKWVNGAAEEVEIVDYHR